MASTKDALNLAAASASTYPKPVIGAIVRYRLSQQDADATNKRRADAQAHLQDHRENSNGVQIHMGNAVSEGDIFPMMMTRVWNLDPGTVNGQVFLDGNDTLWVTSVVPGMAPRTYCYF